MSFIETNKTCWNVFYWRANTSHQLVFMIKYMWSYHSVCWSTSVPEVIFCPMWLGIGHWRLSRLNHLLVAENLRIVSLKVRGSRPSLCVLVIKTSRESMRIKTLTLNWSLPDSEVRCWIWSWPLHQTAQELLNLLQNFRNWRHFFEGVFITERLKHKLY